MFRFTPGMSKRVLYNRRENETLLKDPQASRSVFMLKGIKKTRTSGVRETNRQRPRFTMAGIAIFGPGVLNFCVGMGTGVTTPVSSPDLSERSLPEN